MALGKKASLNYFFPSLGIFQDSNRYIQLPLQVAVEKVSSLAFDFVEHCVADLVRHVQLIFASKILCTPINEGHHKATTG